MRITADSIAIGRGPAAALPAVSFSAAPGDPAIIPVDTAGRPTVLALAAAGRMRLTAGRMLVDGRPQTTLLRSITAIVDAPSVAEPPEDVEARHVVREELVLAAGRAAPDDVRRMLSHAGASDYADAPLGALPGAVRTRLLAECAASRRGVRALVLTSPERHGAEPQELDRLVRALDDRGFAVLVLTSAAMRTALTLAHGSLVEARP